jgi:hypothetical protein
MTCFLAYEGMDLIRDLNTVEENIDSAYIISETFKII